MPDNPSVPLIPESLKQCKTLVRFIEDLDARLLNFRNIELNKVHNAVTAANLRGEISDEQGAELQRLIQDRRRPHLGGG
jgi:hypothetical protein